MADCIVPHRTAIIKCKTCGTMYVPDRKRDRHIGLGRYFAFEACPVCGQDENGYNQIIPLWKYNLIRYFRHWGKGQHV